MSSRTLRTFAWAADGTTYASWSTSTTARSSATPRERKTSDLVKSAFATLKFPLSDIEVLYTDRGGEFASAAIDEMLEVFGIERSLSRKGCPYDNAVIESCSKTLKATLIYRNAYGSLDQLRRSLNAWVWWYNNERIHSTLGYMSPVEFRMAGLSL